MKTKSLSREILVLAVVNFLNSVGVYVTLPVLALYFHTTLGIPIAQVGILLGLPPVIGAVLGSFGVVLARKLGEIACLSIAMLLLVIPYVGYLFVTNYIALLLMSGLLGVSRVFWSPIIKSMFAHHARKLHTQKLAFQINYITICLGAIVGPLVAMVPALSGRGAILISAAFFALIVLVLVVSRNLLRIQAEPAPEGQAKRAYRLSGLDPRLFFYILAGFLVFVVFSQFETVFSLALQEVNQNPERLFSLLLILNSVAGILIQFLIIWLGKRLKTITMLLSGNLGFAVAFLLFSGANGNLLWLVVATLLFSVGEVLAIPSADMIINDIAPAAKRTLYFSVAEFRTLGFSLGPICASFVLETHGAYYMFLSSTVVIMLASGIYAVPAVLARYRSLPSGGVQG